MNLSHAGFSKLSVPAQSLVLVALSAPMFAVFAIAGDLSRGALAWTFLGALMMEPPEGRSIFGEIIQPIALLDGCIDYAFLWSWQTIFKGDCSNGA